MQRPRRAATFNDHLQAILQLRLEALPDQIPGLPLTRSQWPKAGGITDLATVRSLLVTFNALHARLKAIAATQEIDLFYEHRKPLLDEVLPGTEIAYDLCRQALLRRGATELPIATKLATLANNVYDLAARISRLISAALQYAELRYTILRDIELYLNKAGFGEIDVDPLVFCIDTSLPTQVEAFTTSASSYFPSAVSELQAMAQRISERGRSKVQEVRALAARTTAARSSDLVLETESPLRPRLNILRGMRCRQHLQAPKPRVVSLRELELRTEDWGRSKENTGESPSKYFERIETLSKERSARKISKDPYFMDIPRAGAASKPHAGLDANRPPVATDTAATRKTSAARTRLQQPTVVERRKVKEVRRMPSMPLREQLPGTNNLRSKISRPTLVETPRTRRSFATTPRLLGQEPRRVCSSTPRLNGALSSLGLSPRLSPGSDTSSSVEETPCARSRQGASSKLAGAPRARSSSIQVPRLRGAA